MCKSVDILKILKEIIITHLVKNSCIEISNYFLIFYIKRNKHQMTKNNNDDLVSRIEAQEMIEKALRRHNRRSTIISSILGWILIGGYSFGLFHVVQNT